MDRYIDKHLIAFSIEERIHVLRTKLAGVTADFELAPFWTRGRCLIHLRTSASRITG